MWLTISNYNPLLRGNEDRDASSYSHDTHNQEEQEINVRILPAST